MSDSQPAPSTSPAANDASSESVPQVAYVCRANGGWSAISRLLTESYAQGRVVALSAGTEPGERIHPRSPTR